MLICVRADGHNVTLRLAIKSIFGTIHVTTDWYKNVKIIDHCTITNFYMRSSFPCYTSKAAIDHCKDLVQHISVRRHQTMELQILEFLCD